MMADVRALLKAKREEQRIVHPFAAYNPSGALRCTVCGTLIKHASAWNGHLGSKSHRTNVARLKEEERLREEEKRQGKRKVDDDDIPMNEPAKRPRVSEDDTQGPLFTASSASGFPADFFSDPSRSFTMGEVDSDEDVGQNDPPLTQAYSQPHSNLDMEWAEFQEAVINGPVDTDSRETFERATVFAEPQLSTEIPEGFPSTIVLEEEPQRVASPTSKDAEAERKRRAEEDKELIMDRLLDEERAQEEADERVNVLKAKFDLLKQKRFAAKAAKTNK